jgi:tetratricopeptide (TPR) repeat protein
MSHEQPLGADYTPATGPTTPAGGPTSASDERLSGIVAVVIAFATLVAALAGYLQADASNQAGDWRDQAEQLSLQALSSSQSAQQSSQVSFEAFQHYVEQRTESGNALLASMYAGAAGDTDRQQELLRESERWDTLATSTLTLTDIDPAGEYGPDQDPTFPRRYFAKATQESLRLNALADAANEQATQTDQRAAAYTAILATLAVSLYLFGLTLAVSGRLLRYGFFGVGIVLLIVGTLWIGQTLIAAGGVSDDQAATEYATGKVAALTAVDSTGFHDAEAHFSRAIELRPTFARAYADRASVIFQGASPQRTGYVSIASPDALQRARADLEKARSLGLANAQVLGDLGFYSFSEGLQSNNVDLLNDSVAYTRQAIQLDPAEPVYRYNLGVALAAAGQVDEARVAYNDGTLRTLYVDDAFTEPRGNPAAEEQILAGALTDLDTVAKYKPDLAATVQSLKELIVGRVAGQTKDQPTPSPATFSNLQLDVFPAEVQWQADITDFDADRDTISAQWYHQDPQGLGWAVIPEISVSYDPTTPEGQRSFVLAPYLSLVSPAQCLPAGQYRVELYVNGRYAATGTVQSDFPDYQAFLGRDLTSAFCRPADWVRRSDAIPGLIDGFNSPDNRMGVYVARYGVPGSLRALSDLSAQMEDLTVTAFSEWFPGTPVYDEASGTTDDYFEGLSDTAWRFYDYGTGLVEVGAGVTSDGAVSVGMVYGPYDWFNTTEPTQILNSMIHVE